jgi:hypothetical protein
MADDREDRRSPTIAQAVPGPPGWLSLTDDELLYRIESLAPDHQEDAQLVAVVRSQRHFFVRQEAAKRIRDAELLKPFETDRHIGQILARQMRRVSDVTYLEKLVRESRHLEVRNAAAAQLQLLRAALVGKG